MEYQTTDQPSCWTSTRIHAEGLFKGDADYVEATVIPPHWAEIGCKQLMMPRS